MRMEIETLESLKPNPKNPRTISKEDFEALRQSIQRFGDLSGIVKNQRSGQLVGGHMRKRAFESLGGQKKIMITQNFEVPNKQGTIAIGYVTYDNEFFSYRLVDWDEGTEKAAGIAANRIEGTFDLDLLSQVNWELSQLENGDDLLKLTGQTQVEINSLLKSVGAEAENDQPKGDGAEHLNLRLSPEQLEVVNEAFGNAKTKIDNSQVASSSYDGLALELICKEYLTQLHDQPENTNVAQ
jgi:hypothetical protein